MFAAEPISYQQTLAFSKLVVDYVAGSEDIRPFHAFPPTIEGIKSSLEARKHVPIDREVLVRVLTDQYKSLPPSEAVNTNIALLAASATFTVCTAHQPNLLTGPLYFIYKILHAIKLAAALKKDFPRYDFVPVYYMGSEDADLEELNHFTVQGKKYVWNTGQQGAVGRMKVDQNLLSLIKDLEGQIGVEKHGLGLIELFENAYKKDALIQDATAAVVHNLFQKYGLVVLNPDDRRLKANTVSIFEKDLFDQSSVNIVNATSDKLNKQYRAQAHPREINLFYLQDNMRQRIIKKGNGYAVVDTDLHFTEVSLKEELHAYPERFSPNVILRGVFQEMILPNIAFVGGGGELSYWLQLKDLFEHYKVPFPVQVLRNSFLIIEKGEQAMIDKLNLPTKEIFRSEEDLMKIFIEQAGKTPQLDAQVEGMKKVYDGIASAANSIDTTLTAHVSALRAGALKQLASLEKKMLRAEKRKHSDTLQQIRKLKDLLFPNKGLQERVENFSSYYAKWGPHFIDSLLQNSPILEQQFTVLKESEA